MILRLAECIARNEDFGKCLETFLAEKGLTPSEFSRRSGIPRSTLYKILKGYKPRYDTLVRIFSAFHEKRKFVALIAARYVVEEIKFDDRVKVYPATTLEDAIVAAVRAEKEGAEAVICAPIISSLIEKLVDIPVITIRPEKSVIRAVNTAVEMLNLR